MLELMRCVVFCMLDAVQNRLLFAEMLEVFKLTEMLETMRCLVLCMLDAVNCGPCLLEVMRWILLCMREDCEGGHS